MVLDVLHGVAVSDFRHRHPLAFVDFKDTLANKLPHFSEYNMNINMLNKEFRTSSIDFKILSSQTAIDTASHALLRLSAKN